MGGRKGGERKNKGFVRIPLTKLIKMASNSYLERKGRKGEK